MKKTKVGDVGSIVLNDCEVLSITNEDQTYPTLVVSTPVGQFEVSDVSFVRKATVCRCGKQLSGDHIKFCPMCGKANPDAGA